MPDNLYWINLPWPGRLAASPRPRGGDWLEDDVAAWRGLGVEVVVSLLTSEEAQALQLEAEQAVCRKVGMEFFSLPIIDRSFPANPEEFSALVNLLGSRIQRGKTVVIHCRQGIGRSGLIVIALLLQGGNQIDEAIQIATTARGLPVPETQEQLDWIRNLLQKRE